MYTHYSLFSCLKCSEVADSWVLSNSPALHLICSAAMNKWNVPKQRENIPIRITDTRFFSPIRKLLSGTGFALHCVYLVWLLISFHYEKLIVFGSFRIFWSFWIQRWIFPYDLWRLCGVSESNILPDSSQQIPQLSCNFIQ